MTSPAPSPLTLQQGQTKMLTEKQIKHIVNRFLGWRLPENFNPDVGISFKPMFNTMTTYPQRNEPIGTNLFSATQAEAMVRYMLDGIPVELERGAVQTGELDARCEQCTFNCPNEEGMCHLAAMQAEAKAHALRSLAPQPASGEGQRAPEVPGYEHPTMRPEPSPASPPGVWLNMHGAPGGAVVDIWLPFGPIAPNVSLVPHDREGLSARWRALPGQSREGDEIEQLDAACELGDAMADELDRRQQRIDQQDEQIETNDELISGFERELKLEKGLVALWKENASVVDAKWQAAEDRAAQLEWERDEALANETSSREHGVRLLTLLEKAEAELAAMKSGDRVMMERDVLEEALYCATSYGWEQVANKLRSLLAPAKEGGK